MTVYYINKLCQFNFKYDTLTSLSSQTIKEIFSLKDNDQIVIDLNNLEHIYYIKHDLFNTCSKELSIIQYQLQNQVCSLKIRNMNDLKEIKSRAFYQIGCCYKDKFQFIIENCPKLELIEYEAFYNVATEAPSLDKIVLQFCNCKSLKKIDDQAFMGFGNKSKNVIGIDLRCTNLEMIGSDCFYNAFYESTHFTFIELSRLKSLNWISNGVFEYCGFNSEETVQINISTNELLQEVGCRSFDDVGQKRIIDVRGTNHMKSFDEAFNHKTTEVIKDQSESYEENFEENFGEVD